MRTKEIIKLAGEISEDLVSYFARKYPHADTDIITATALAVACKATSEAMVRVIAERTVSHGAQA